MQDCSALQKQLDDIDNLLECLSQPGVRSVRDSDGSEIQYSLGNISHLQERRRVVQAQLNACQSRGGPFGFVF